VSADLYAKRIKDIFTFSKVKFINDTEIDYNSFLKSFQTTQQQQQQQHQQIQQQQIQQNQQIIQNQIQSNPMQPQQIIIQNTPLQNFQNQRITINQNQRSINTKMMNNNNIKFNQINHFNQKKN
jgi:hypothetical protein